MTNLEEPLGEQSTAEEQYGFTPFKDSMTQFDEYAEDTVDSAEFYCGPLGTGIVEARRPKEGTPEDYNWNEEDMGFTIDENGNVIKKTSRELEAEGLYYPYVLIHNPITKSIREGIIINFWIPGTNLEAISLLKRTDEEHAGKYPEDDTWTGSIRLATLDQNGRISEGKEELFLKREDLPRLHLSLTQSL